MITSLQEYCKFLYLIQEDGTPDVAVLLPGNEPILKIDLNTRKIESPEFLSVTTDHRSETVFFRVNRYFDNVDLSEMSCVIQFINAAGESGIYVVPFYDITTLGETQEMLIPWVIEGAVTAAAGKVLYSVQFFRVAEGASHYTYNLNTLVATSKVLEGNKFDTGAVIDGIEATLGKTLDELAEDEKIDFTFVNSNLAAAYEALINKMDDIKDELKVYWLDV